MNSIIGGTPTLNYSTQEDFISNKYENYREIFAEIL